VSTRDRAVVAWVERKLRRKDIEKEVAEQMRAGGIADPAKRKRAAGTASDPYGQ
jgi:hypothetical protein